MTDAKGNEAMIQEVWRVAWERPAGRWPSIRWGTALLLPVAVVLWAASLLLAPDDPDLFTISVVSQAAGGEIKNASVRVGDVLYLTNEDGRVAIDPVLPGTAIVVSADGHETIREEDPEEPGGVVDISLSGVLVMGTLTDRVSGEPVGNGEVAVVNPSGGVVATTGTDESGTFIFKFVPENAEILVRHEIYGEHRQAMMNERSVHVQLEPPVITGRAVDIVGEPLAKVSVASGGASTVTNEDGTFTLAGVGQGSALLLQGEPVGEATVVVSGTDLGDIPVSGPSESPNESATVWEGQ